MIHANLKELAAALAAKKISSLELTDLFLGRIAQHNPLINAFITLDEDKSRTAAIAADAARAAGQAGPLTGIPIAHKDIFCQDGWRTTCGSHMLEKFIAPYNATVIERCNQAGLVPLGKVNMDEFAMGSSNETSYYGPVRNPWDTERVPGGSSGGSAAAVAARLAPAATGTDTGGSIRQPAALCGLTGLKPSYGTVSRWGMIAFASSLDQAGPMAASAEDCGLLLNAFAGFDAKDSTSLERDNEDYTRSLAQPLKGLRIGLPKEFFNADGDAATMATIETALAEYRKLGAETVEVSLPSIGQSVSAYYVIAPAEASSNLSRFDGVRYGHRAAAYGDLNDMYAKSRAEGFGEEVKRRILIGTYVLSHGYYDAYYLQAQRLRRLIANDFEAAFQQCDVIASPTTTGTAFKFGEKSGDPVQMYLSDIYTIGVNLAGIPALSHPCGLVNDLPTGMQLIGPYFSEHRLLNITHQYQQVTDWHRRTPAAFA
ncbi:MAG: Asp-tRNA(Asn)/Glu-tRNA(Gln) amidotransferase subunit GatA [Fluviibacter sp.]